MKLLLMILFFAISAVAQTATGKAVVYVYSFSAPTTFGTVKKPVFVDGKVVSDIRPERYFILLLEPGRHSLHLKNKKLGGIERDFVAGETYYMRVEWRSGAVISPSGFVSVPTDNGVFDLKQLKPVDIKNIKNAEIAFRSLPS